jgi:predicted regulator of Ras-like GTPase activity (Roadblock/LC7/MglB family)
MKLEQMVKNIQAINGYAGSAILDKEGEILYIDENKHIDLAFSSSLFNDTFRTLNRGSLDIGFSNLVRLETETEEGMIFLIYSNNIHTIFTIFNPKGNISLAKMMLIQSLKKSQ